MGGGPKNLCTLESDDTILYKYGVEENKTFHNKWTKKTN